MKSFENKLLSGMRLCLMLLLVGSLSTYGQEAADPYIWLEEVEAEKSLEWVEKQNEKTLTVFENRPIFDEIYNESLEMLDSDDRIAYPSIIGDQVYNFWRDKTHERGIWRRMSLADYIAKSTEWETVLDFDSLSKAEGEKWVYKGGNILKPDYKKCLLRLSRGGADAVEIREFDLETKTFVDEGFFLPESKARIDWIDENTLYVGTDFGEGSMTESGYPRITKKWKRGTPLSEAETIYEGKSTDTWVSANVYKRGGRQYHTVSRALTFYEYEHFLIKDGKLVEINIPNDVYPNFLDDQLILHLKSDWELGDNTYPQGALISMNFDQFMEGKTEFEVIFKPEERTSIDYFTTTKDYLLVNMLNNVKSELYIYKQGEGKWEMKKVPMENTGRLSVSSTTDLSNNFFFSFRSFLQPTTLYYFEEDSSEPMKINSLPSFFDTDGLEVHQYEATSKDGTKIPYFIVQQENLTLTGSNPTLLYGYGGFEIAMLPSYNSSVGKFWLENGGVYVVANIRGGGEFGPAWHQSALKENRQRAYDDFHAVAEDLVERKVTSPEHLGIMGGSNGGLLVGVAVTQRPDLYSAVACLVPLLDMKRYHKLLAGSSWMAEYGNPDKAEEWEYIRQYSPYQNVSKDATYPKVFFLTSTRDDRVHPGHARKMAAKMEEMGHDLYYYENTEGGHAGASTNKQVAFRNALVYTYLMDQLTPEEK